MHHVPNGQFVFILGLGALSLVGCSHVADRQHATLANLRAGMEWVHGGELDEGPRALDREPPLDDLVGVERRRLVSLLGEPRVCVEPLRSPCRDAGERVFLFYTQDSPEPGPAMVVRFDAEDRISSARWRQVEVLEPAGPSDGQSSQLADSSTDSESNGPSLEIQP